MLKRKALRKIIITTFSIITLLVICIIPGKLNNNKNFLNPNIETIYVGNINGNEIYLLSKNNYLAATNVIITEENIVDKIRKIVEYLTINKSSKIPNGLSAIINEATVLNDVYVEKGIAILNFSSNLLNTTPEMERKIIESLTYSLINLDGIEGIKILIDDNILAKLPQTGEKLPDVLNRSFGINKKYEINSINDTSKITMYYLNDINGVFYSIPVTKYLNDDRDKIKVIIDNLSSTYLYEPSLISLVSLNTKLTSSV